jgi:phage terminase large subunit-like protein
MNTKAYYEKTFERHSRDLRSSNRNIRYNKGLAKKYIILIETFTHHKGELAGKRIRLETWQKKLVSILFGWEKLREDGTWVRRFRTGFIFVPRKNGKTLLGSAVMIADMILRPDEGGETAFFATKRDQAKLAYNSAIKILKAHSYLSKHTKESYGKAIYMENDTEIYALGRDSTTLDGLNVTRALADEHHAHPDDSLWDVVKSSQTARREPLMLSITTAGFSISSPAYNMYLYAKQVLEGIIEDDSFFAFIAEAPQKPKDDSEFYFREETWRLANPNYGVSLNKEEFELAGREARDRPEKLNNFLVKYLNIWTTSTESFLSLEDWNRCEGEIVERGKCIIGLDLSIRDDFTAMARVYRVEAKYHIHINFYIPRARIFERERELRVPLMSWVKGGWITATEGNSIDYEYILHDIKNGLDTTEAFCYDPYQARYIVNELENYGYSAIFPIRQGFLTLSEPTSFLLKLIRDRKIVHNGNPVLTWMVANTTVLSDPAGNIKPNKKDYNRKIDGVVAIINCLAYLIHEDKPTPSVYEERGLRRF